MIITSGLGFGIILSALLVCMSDLLYTILDGHTKKPQNRVYICILLLLSVNAVCELAGQVSIASDSTYLVPRIFTYIYFLSHSMVAPMLYHYISLVVGHSVGIFLPWKSRRSGSRMLKGAFQFLAIAVPELFIALNPFMHWCWYHSADGTFHRAWGEFLFVYAVAAIWMIASFILLMRSWNILSKGRKRSIAICFLLAVAGIFIQLLSRDYRVEVLMEALGFTGVLLFVENEDDRRNVELDAYNSAAFTLDMTAAIRNRMPVQVIILRSIHFDKTANSVVALRFSRDAISQAVSGYLGTIIRRYQIYAIGNGRFALVLRSATEDEAAALAQTIRSRFEKPWTVDGMDIILTAKTMLVRVPEDAKTVEELLYIAECPIPEDMTAPIIQKEALGWIIRRAAVEKAVTNGLEAHAFEVYYQPTYHMDKTLHGAEALLRMHDKDMGMVYPDEFIPIAEQLGIIDLLDEFVLREVCGFIRTGIPAQNGMDCINVNLSVLECMKEGFAEHISQIVSDTGVPKQMINFEITESAAAQDYARLAGVVAQLRAQGFQFSIDDYGTGYSNMTSLFSLGVDIIKIDKSLLWNSETSELGMTLLKASMEMVHKLKKKALMEGVETESHIRILRELGCDFLQGYYFSKPVPKADFVAMIEKKA